jgi:hypothetical protein
MAEQIANRHREEVVGVHQSRRPRHDAVPVRVRIVRERDAILIFETDEPRQTMARARATTPGIISNDA